MSDDKDVLRGLAIAKATFQLRALKELIAKEPDCPDCGLPHPSRNPYCFCRRASPGGEGE